MAEWPCCHDPLRFSPMSLRFVPPPHAHSHTPPSPLSPAPALRFETTPATRRLCPPDPSMPLLVGIPPPCPCHVVPQKLGKGMKTWNLDQRKTHDTCHRPYHDACHGALHGAREPSQGATGPCLVPVRQAKVARGLAWCPPASQAKVPRGLAWCPRAKPRWHGALHGALPRAKPRWDEALHGARP